MGEEDYLREIAAHRIPAEELPYFLEMPSFRARWARLGLTDADLHILQMRLAARPDAGAVVGGTNGIRKLRFSAAGSNVGKSGAYRIFYLNLVEHDVVILMSALAKNEQDNLSKAQRNALAGLISQIRAEFETRRRS